MKRRIFNKTKTWTVLLSTILLLTIISIGTGCTNSDNAQSTDEKQSADPVAATEEVSEPREKESSWEPYDENGEETVLTVMYVNEEMFYRDYGNLFQARDPNVEFKLVSTSDTRGEGDMLENYKKILNQDKPDVLLLNLNQYEALAGEGLLLDFEAPIKRSGFDLAGMVPGVIELLKDRGGGRLYGLANMFKSKALFYNKKLFDEYGVPYPAPGMGWEIVTLASRFPNAGSDGKPLYGLLQSQFTVNPFELVQQIGLSDNLATLDPTGKKLLYGAQSWSGIFEKVIEGYRNNHINEPNSPFRDNGDGTQSLYMESNSFIDGRAAMTVDDLSQIQMMDMMEGLKQNPTFVSFEWDTVTVPVNPRNPNETADFDVPYIYAIPRDSDQTSLAWEFIQYIHSEKLMRMLSKSSSLDLLARTGFEKDFKGRDLSDFYALGPDLTTRKPLVPVGFTKGFGVIAEEEIDAALKQERTAEEAMARIQERGQKLLDEKLSSDDKEIFDLGELIPAAE